MKNIIKNILVLLMVCVFAFSCLTAAAEEATSTPTDAATGDAATGETVELSKDVQEIIDLLGKLPAADKVTEKDGKNIKKIRKLYIGLEASDKKTLGADNLTKLNDTYTAYLPYLIADVLEGMESLPKRVKAKDSDKLKDVYANYELLNDDALDSLDKDTVDKFLVNCKKFAPEILGDKADDIKVDEKDTGSDAPTILGMLIWEFAILVMLALVILFNIALIVFTSIKIFKTAK